MNPRERYVRNSDLELLTSQMTQRRLDRLREVAFNRQRGLTVVMDWVKNAFNLGAISRTVEAFGVTLVHFSAPDYFDPKKEAKPVAKAANKWVDFQYHNTTAECITYLHDNGYTVAALVLSPQAKPLYDVSWADYDQLAIVIGNEHDGVSETAQQLTDVHVQIPMRGMSESLNVSVATAITLSEITRQRTTSVKDFTLAEDEAKALYEEYIRRAAAKWHHD